MNQFGILKVYSGAHLAEHSYYIDNIIVEHLFAIGYGVSLHSYAVANLSCPVT